MATIYKPTITRTDRKTGAKRRTKARCWYIRYEDASGKRRQVKGYTDKAATQALAVDLVRRAERERVGLIDPHDEHRRRPLAEHIAGFERYLADKDNSAEYVDLTIQRVRSIVEGIDARTIDDVTASRVSEYLAGRRKGDLSIESSNHYFRAMRNFCRWMVRDRRIAENPIAHLSTLKADKDRRHQRRDLTADEFSALIDATFAADTRRGLTSEDRAMLYISAAYTGLRASELASLTPRCFDFDADPPTVTVSAKTSKHSEQDMIVLRTDLAAMLRRWIGDKAASDPLWPGKWAEHKAAGKMLRADLELAGVAYQDASGRFADFHALRHTFVSGLAKGGVHPKVAQTLARHKKLELTMNVYTHTHTEDLVEALATLPALPGGPADGADGADGKSVTRTGTDDLESVAPYVALDGDIPCQSVAVDGSDNDAPGATADERKPLETSALSSDSHDMSANEGDGARTRNLRIDSPVL